MDWLDNNKIKVNPPKRPKKITGTRFAAIMGLNRWSSPFKAWCEITRTYEEPFEDTIYTIAGKTIEPKQAEYMKKFYFMPNLTTPSDIWGEDYFKQTWGDFFPDFAMFGGMWDYILRDKNSKPTAVLEMKTSKRVEDWAEDVPEYYALQAALYAHLLGVEQVYMVASFLDEGDYEKPEDFVPNASNTKVIPFRLHERYPDFEVDYLDAAIDWWHTHVETGISPEYDEKADADILKALRTTTPDAGDDRAALIREAEALKAEIDEHAAAIKEKEDRYKAIMDALKKDEVDHWKDGAKKVIIPGSRYEWTISRTDSRKIDTDALKTAGLYETYSKPETTYRVTVKEKKA